MKLFPFEMKKIWRQRKLVWLIVIASLCTSGIYLYNTSNQSMKEEHAREEIESYIDETDQLQANLMTLQREEALDGQQTKQLEHLEKIGSSFFYWSIAISDEDWGEIPTYEKDFLTHVEAFEAAGGEFSALQGTAREKAIQKNAWLREYNLPYEDEAYPIIPSLILKTNVEILLGILGVFILLLFFGTTITTEKEQHTWSTIKTQPLPKWRRIVEKYASLLAITVIFVAIVIGIGLLVPVIFGGHSLAFQYPQVFETGESHTIISTAQYIIRSSVLFICASGITFSLVVCISSFVKKAFSGLMLTGFILTIGYFTTNLYPPFQSILNPFQYLQFSNLLETVPSQTDWLYLLGAFFWILLFLVLAVLLQEHKVILFKSSANKRPFHRGNIQTKSLTLGKMCRFEWRKTYRKGLLKQLSIILLLLIAFGYFVIYTQSIDRKESYYETLTKQVEGLQRSISYMEKMLASFEEKRMEAEQAGDEAKAEYYSNPDSRKKIEKIIEYDQLTIDKLNDAIEGIEQQNWLPLYMYQLHKNEFSVYGLEEDGEIYIHADIRDLVGQMTLDASIAEKHWLIEKNIQPIFSGEFINTIFHNWGDHKKYGREWEEANRKVDHSGLYTLYIYFQQYFYIIPMILFLFLLGAGFASERGKKQTLNLLRTQPLRKSTIFLGKVVHANIVALLSYICVFIVVVGISTLFNRFGDWQYPILHYDSASIVSSSNYTGMKSIGFMSGFHFVNLGDYLVESIILILFIMLFFIVLAHFLSLFIRNQLTVLATTILIGIVGYGVSSQILTDKAHLSPFTYFDVPRIMNGEIAMLLNNPNLNLLTGCIIFLSAILLFCIIGYIVLNRKQKNI